MLTSPPGAPRLPGYDLREPTEADARESLRRVFGAERAPAVWAEACRTAGIPVDHVRNAVLLERAARGLAAQGGPAAVVARSIEIRLRTYARLAANAAAAGGTR